MLRLKVLGFPRFLNGIHEGSGERAVVASDAPLGWRRRGTTTGCSVRRRGSWTSTGTSSAKRTTTQSTSSPTKSTPSRIRAKPAGAPTPDAPQRCRRRLCDDEDSADDDAERDDAVAVYTGLLFISRFRELRGAKGSKLSPELRFALAFVAPKVQVGIGASLVSALGLFRTWYTEVQGYYWNG